MDHTPNSPVPDTARAAVDAADFEPHSHVFDVGNPIAERRTRQVMWLTLAMMVVEIVAGTLFGSMALLADGWHMSSHALALGVSAGAYALARRHAHDPRFAFGTSKIEVLGGYTSAVFLIGVAAYMAIESVQRLLQPAPIRFDEAMPVAVLGLAVNVVSAWLLSSGTHGHDHSHGHAHHSHHSHAPRNARGRDHAQGRRHGHDDGDGHEHGHAHPHATQPRLAPAQTASATLGRIDSVGTEGSDADVRARSPHPGAHAHDLNLRSAYLHVVADAATSVLAIVALAGGRYFGVAWLDPVMGLLGSVLVGRWAVGLLRDTGRVLLDAEMDSPLAQEIRDVVAGLPGSPRVRDLHLIRVGKGRYACILSLAAAPADLTPAGVRRALGVHEELVHVTVEIERGG